MDQSIDRSINQSINQSTTCCEYPFVRRIRLVRHKIGKEFFCFVVAVVAVTCESPSVHGGHGVGTEFDLQPVAFQQLLSKFPVEANPSAVRIKAERRSAV